MHTQGTLAVLVMVGVGAFAGPAAAGKCDINKEIWSLLSDGKNETVKNTYDGLVSVKGRLAKLGASGNTSFYPANQTVRDKLITRFEEGIGNQQDAFDDFLKDVVAARSDDCAICRYLPTWKSLSSAGYPKVTGKELSAFSSQQITQIDSYVETRKVCRNNARDDEAKQECDSSMKKLFKQALGSKFIEDYTDNDGYPGGQDFQTKMAGAKVEDCPLSKTPLVRSKDAS